jgi:multidrug efflux pump subunit AcrB
MSFFILQAMDITLNMIVLFSLVLALGMLVDNGIVIVENIFRHVAMGKSRKQAAIEGSGEVAFPILASTATTCLAFLPIVFMPGVMGDFMSYLPKTVIVVLTCSLVVAVVINPVFCAAFLNISEKNRKKITEGSGTFLRFQQWYERVVRWAVKRNLLVLGLSFTIVILGFVFYVIYGKGTIFFPYIDPETGVVAIELPQGSPLDTTDAIVSEIEEIIPRSPASLKNYIATTGRGSDDNVFGGGDENHKANVRVEYKQFFERKIKGTVAIDSLRSRLKNITGADIVVKELNFAPPTGNPVSYQVTGEDYAVLGSIADSVLAILHTFPGLKQIECDYEAAKPEINIEIDRRKASRYKLSTTTIASTIRNAISGGTLGTFRQGADEYDINVRFSKEYRNSANRLANLQIVNEDDDRIPLSSVASISPRSSVGIIQRRNLDRAVQVWADFKEDTKNKAQIKNDIDSLVNQLHLPDEYYIGEGGGIEMRKESEEYIGKAMVIALFLVFMVLIAQFNSLTQSIIIMLTVLMSFSGVFWGYALTGQSFIIIMTGIGCIALAGVVVNNGIVLIDYANLLIARGMPWKDAIVEAAKTRLRPVLLTAITTVLGMSPMAIGVSFDFHKMGLQIGSDSGQMWIAFAWAMIFGLSFATLMTLIVVPCLLKVNFSMFPPKTEKS